MMPVWIRSPSRLALLSLGLLWLAAYSPALCRAAPLGIAGPARAFVYPLMSPKESSRYGMRKHPILHRSRKHVGVDLAAPEGAPIRAMADGVVIFADPHGTYGNLAVVEHVNHITTHYGHCRTLRVNPGQKVKAGQIIATVGSTGRVSGPHLHLEIRKEGVPVDPEQIFPGLDLDGQG